MACHKKEKQQIAAPMSSKKVEAAAAGKPAPAVKAAPVDDKKGKDAGKKKK
ncbi:MAG: hypothetical protein RBR05_00510 [Candidatus Methanomethylophilaceae archaeon]|nr:hypothetical protein [Candidatus Methanomethylophilaceae archaeon]MDD3379003.1 hypothetical protein [Candidatus Methanomethylophilaceae archaeon]MDY0223869.1 hypothetical protein [Candidatus Methanomethylophilaceae archaeon]